MRDFLLKTLLRSTTACVYVCSLVNEKGQKDGPTERHILTRDLEHMDQFMAQWDILGRGMFVAVSTLLANSRRVKQNAIETVFYHLDVDLKSIDLTADEAFEALKNCTHPPTIINSSGHGLHAYWCLSKPIVSDDKVEAILKEVARVFAGDKQVTQRVALMRLPGSHNTKNGEWLEVSTIYEGNHYYDNDEITEWFLNAEIIIRRKGTVEDFKPEPLNPFAQYADQYGFKPPIDVEQRLAEMSYQGPGDSAIHATQVAVTASMLSAGRPIEEVVETVLNATKAVAPDNWDWVAEEKTIHGMCKGWMRKLAKKEEKVSNVVNLQAHRIQRATDGDEEPPEEAKGKPKKGVIHKVLADGVREALKRRGWGILFIGEDVWRCIDGVWSLLTPGQAKMWLEGEIELGCRALSIISTNKVINEAFKWITREPEIKKDSVPWDAHGKIATQSGLLDPATMEIEELKPEHYVTMRIECAYDPKAKCPTWEQMLLDTFKGDIETISVVQEVAGTGLIPHRDKALRKAMIVVGQSNSGKSTLINVISGLFTNAPNMTPFDALENTHGTTEFLKNIPWVLHEAFDQSKWHTSGIVKALISGDSIPVEIKNGPRVNCVLNMPILWGTNTPPQFKEASRAIENRVCIVKCKQVFDSNNPTGAAKEVRDKGFESLTDYVLAKEKSGLLNWFIEGMLRAKKRGYLADTEEIRQSSKELRRNANFMQAFFEEAIVYSPSHMVTLPDFTAAIKRWWEENHGEGRNPPSPEFIKKNLTSLYDSRIAMEGLKFHGIRVVAGVMLNEEGIDFWKVDLQVAGARGDMSGRVSKEEKDVNKKIPVEWYDKPIIQSMVDAHTAKKEK